jgi:hypothetical protein
MTLFLEVCDGDYISADDSTLYWRYPNNNNNNNNNNNGDG